MRRGGRRGRGRWDRFVPSFGGGSAVDRASRRREGWGFDVIIIIGIIGIGRVSRAWEMRHVSGCPEVDARRRRRRRGWVRAMVRW